MHLLNTKVDKFLHQTEKCREEFIKLREIILDCDLQEELKWGVPCYTFENIFWTINPWSTKSLPTAFLSTNAIQVSDYKNWKSIQKIFEDKGLND